MNKSENINELATALSLLQGEIKDVHKDKQGYGYSYANLSQVLEEVRPLLSKNGLSVSQLLFSKDDFVGVETVLLHKSGQWISSKIKARIEKSLTRDGKQKMSLAQEAGSIISYLRRYALAACVGITQTDNDAHLRGEDHPKITTQQENTITNLLKKTNTQYDSVRDYLSKSGKPIAESLDEVSQEDAAKIINLLQQKLAKIIQETNSVTH